MGLIDLIKQRRSIRNYENIDVPYEKIIELLEAAIWAPSSGNLQNWYFIIIKNRDKINKIAEFSDQEFIKKASAIIVVCSNDEIVEKIYGERGKLYAIQNTAAAIQNILLLATEKNLGTCWIGAFDENKVKELLKIPKNISVHALITVGISRENPKPPERKKLSEILFFEEWKNRIYRPSLYPLIDTLNNLLKEIKNLKF
ncbi:MAG: nitroreductase family protein [Candidatus Aenigmatarchaeota archaeon]